MTVPVANRMPLSVHCTLPVVTLMRVGLSDDTVDSSNKLSPQVAVLGNTERVVFVANPNSIPATKLVPACRLQQQHRLDPATYPLSSCRRHGICNLILSLITKRITHHELFKTEALTLGHYCRALINVCNKSNQERFCHVHRVWTEPEYLSGWKPPGTPCSKCAAQMPAC